MSGWQPIETAPRGELIDVWVQSLGYKSADSDEMRPYVEFRVAGVRWDMGLWLSEDGNPHQSLEGFTNLRFTHWMPQPEPPK